VTAEIIAGTVRPTGLIDTGPARRVAVSVYRVIDVVGTSNSSWEEGAADAIKTASQSVRDLQLSFKYEKES
jgi:hypothetical protein